jgi:hypothetical protein
MPGSGKDLKWDARDHGKNARIRGSEKDAKIRGRIAGSEKDLR